MIFDRNDRESDQDYVLRIFLDPWFENATPGEIADFTGVKRKVVRRAIYAWVRSSKVRRIHSHAAAVTDAIGWKGTPEGLVHTALELLAQRAKNREKTQDHLEEETRLFLMENRP